MYTNAHTLINEYDTYIRTHMQTPNNHIEVNSLVITKGSIHYI